MKRIQESSTSEYLNPEPVLSTKLESRCIASWKGNRQLKHLLRLPAVRFESRLRYICTPQTDLHFFIISYSLAKWTSTL